MTSLSESPYRDATPVPYRPRRRYTLARWILRVLRLVSKFRRRYKYDARVVQYVDVPKQEWDTNARLRVRIPIFALTCRRCLVDFRYVPRALTRDGYVACPDCGARYKHKVRV
jgi:DNA-directed RNA polymerase subunit RPC12/RpoP